MAVGKERRDSDMRGMKWNRAISVLLAAMLFVGLWQPAGMARAWAAQDEGLLAGTELLAHYEFTEGGKDSSGNNNNAVIGAGVTVKDGVASLPGGSANGSAFITLPEGMFDRQDTLTISMWLRDNDPRENWLGAFFFGTKKNSSGFPTYYYYFVPCEKQHNTLKSVMTTSANEARPMDTERGLRNSIRTENYHGVWTHYAIVLQPGSMTCYIDGEWVGEEKNLAMKVSDFGTGLQSYIGKSNYDDPLYKGDFKDFRIYKNALTEAQINQIVGKQPGSAQYSMAIDGNKVSKKLSSSLYGLFYEDINSAADGGLYPEMVKNYSFENAYVQKGGDNAYFQQNGYETRGNYKLHWEASPSGNFAINSESAQGTSDKLNENNPHYAILTGNVTLKNGGFAPQNSPNSAAMPVKPVDFSKNAGTYTFSAFTKADKGYAGKLRVKLVNDSGTALTDEQEVSLEADGSWKKVSAELTAAVTANTKGKLMLSVEGAGANDKLSLDMVSVVPHDSYGYGNKNYAYGVGVRQDLVDLMMGLNPKFMRFPGGCIVEGFNWEGLYDWRDSVGPLEERKSNTNRWENWNNQNRTWGYMQSYGFGYHELLSLCEDFGMEPFPIMSAGVLCQYETNGVNAKTGDGLQYFVDMATDLLDYCWGDAATNPWAAKRAQNGHPEPFQLKYLGIGNENAKEKYFDNFDAIKAAVERYANANYPGHELHIISSAGPNAGGPDGSSTFHYALEYAYDRLGQTMPGQTLVDEHYYQSESFMYNQSDRYDYYERVGQGGSNIFVGEYAVRGNNRYNTALAEACYITGLERNADVVTNISYAPLLFKVGSVSWDHDLIYFDEFNTAKSTNYYVQQMFANNYGTDLVETELASSEKDFSNYGSPVLGGSSAAGSIDKVTVYGKDNQVILEDDFNDASNPNGWAQFGSGSGFTISNGRLNFTGTSGINAVYLPKAVEEKWKEFRIEVEGLTKTSGSGGFVVGAGHGQQYYWFHIGKDGAGASMEVTRPERNSSNLTTKTLGNNYPNKYYNTGAVTKIQANDPMAARFNFGVGHKLEASYTSTNVSSEDTAKYDFSSELNQYQTDIYQVVTKDASNVYIKLVNPDKTAKDIQLSFANLAHLGQAEVTVLTGGLNEANAIGDEKIAPAALSMQITEDQLSYSLPRYSVNVIRIPLSQKPAVQKDSLQKLVQEASGLKPSVYTEGSWDTFAKALEEANHVLGNASASQADVDGAYRKLASAVASLVKRPAISKPELQALIQSVSGLKSSHYTAESWKKFAKALADAKNALAEAGQDQDLGNEYNKLKAAKSSLKKKPAQPNPTGVKLNAGKTLKIGKGESYTLKASVKPSKASQKVSWKSSKKSVVSVKNGKMKGLKTGKAVISAKTPNGKIAKCTVTVKNAPKKLRLNGKNNQKTLKKGKKFQIKVVFPSNTYSNKLTYSSNNKKVATVSSKGLVIAAKKKGTAVITVKAFNGKKAKLTIRVK